MPFRYLADLATADAAFEAFGTTVEEMFMAAAEATLGVMIENPRSIACLEEISFQVEEKSLELLLFEFLQELIYSKDARGILPRVKNIRIESGPSTLMLNAQACSIPLDQVRHRLLTDVKAVTFYKFAVEHLDGQWRATVVLDV
ncbi:MAG: archease [Geobacteraceae bacterium]|nr:archease [Geobacteraceae bacterium]